jgi:ornithine carbamoyltransferase
MQPRHLLTLLDLCPAELDWVLERAILLKKWHQEHLIHDSLKNRVLGMIFEKASTRTRVSFESGMAQLGGHALFLSHRDTQLGRGEPIIDSAKVISSMVDIVMIRSYSHATVTTFALHSKVPVINALTDDYHPCQLLADMQTFREHRGTIAGKTVTWIGDGNNMCNSYINAARQFDFHLNIACPVGYEPNVELVNNNADRVNLISDPATAISGSHLLVTDVWTSMGQEEEQLQRTKAFANYQVTPELMDLADNEAIFMHCLPAHRGEEISHDMLDDHRSVVFDEAENRLHSQKALIEFLLLKPDP